MSKRKRTNSGLGGERIDGLQGWNRNTEVVRVKKPYESLTIQRAKLGIDAYVSSNHQTNMVSFNASCPVQEIEQVVGNG